MPRKFADTLALWSIVAVNVKLNPLLRCHAEALSSARTRVRRKMEPALLWPRHPPLSRQVLLNIFRPHSAFPALWCKAPLSGTPAHL